MPRRSFAPLAAGLLVVCAGLTRSQDPAPTPQSLKLVTLSVKQRLALPYLKVPVGPANPLVLAGRAKPITFQVQGDALRADATEKEGFETEIKEGEIVVADLDGPATLDHRPSRSLSFHRGLVSAGELAWWVVDLDALEGKLGADTVRFIDHDADGTFLTAFRDFIARKSDGVLAALGSRVVWGKGVFELTVNEKAATLVEKPDKAYITPDCFQSWPEVASGLARVNDIRGAMNLPPFALGRESSRAALLHARYCTLNSFGHFEKEGKPGYTKEGAKAGPNSIGASGGSVVGAIDSFLATLFHRIPLIDPRLCEIGIGTDGSNTWIEYVSGPHRVWDSQGPVIFPGPARSWTTGTFSSEDPDPLPPQASRSAGLPITCSWFGGEKIEQGVGALTMDKETVECWHSDSVGKDLRSMEEAEVQICLMAKKPLRFRPYRLTLDWTVDGKPFHLDYTFHIGKRS